MATLDPLDQIGETYDDWFNYLELIYRGYAEGQDVDDIDRIYRQEEAQEFKAILEGLQNGTATWRDLQAFEYDFLADIPEFVDYYNAITAKSQYDGFMDDWAKATASNDPEVIKSVINEYENAGVKNNSYFGSTGPTMPPSPAGLPNLTGDPTQMILKAICGGSPVCAGVDICFEPGQTDCIDPSSINDLWEDVVSHVYIVFGDLGLPIPGWIPFPGLLKLPTLGNIWDKIQTTVSDIANSEDDCRANVPDGENPDEYCSSSNRITRAIQEGSQNVITKAGEVLDSVLTTVVGAVQDPAQAAEKIWDWVRGAYGDDPSKAPDWVWSVIIGSEIYGQQDVRNAIEDIIGTDIDDDGNIGTTAPIPFDPNNPNPECTAQGLETAEDGTCVPATPEFGYCQDGVTEKADAEGTNCQEYAPNGFCEDSVTKKDNPEGTNCEEYEPPLSAEEQECNEQGRIFNDITQQCEETCANPEHVVGADGSCGPPEVTPEPCANNATTESGCERCSDGSLPSEHENGDCSQPKIVTETTPTEGYDCTQPKPTGFAGVSWEYACGNTHCTDGTPKADPEGTNCPGYVAPEIEQPVDTASCDQQDRVTNADGSCGECKPGFTPDPENFDQCIQAPPECNDCSCLDYAAANPAECTTCPEGESYCASTGQCEAEGDCPAAEEAEEGGAGGGGGGGGGGMLTSEPLDLGFDIAGDPQLLVRSEFPITDFLAGLFTNSTGGRKA